MNDNQLETLKHYGDLGCYVAMDTSLCKVAYDEVVKLRQQVTLLREALFSIAAREMYPVQIALDGLAATAPKEQGT